MAAFGDKIDRAFLKRTFNKWPLATLVFVQTRRAFANVGGVLKSKLNLSGAAKESASASLIPKETGYAVVAPGDFGEIPGIVAAANDVYGRHKDDLATREAKKLYFFNILTEADLLDHPILLDFALSKTVTEAAMGYMGQVPRLHSLGVFYSAVNDTTTGSQLYHVDGDALAQVKCFINAWDVNKGSGAFTFMPKNVTSNVLRNKGLIKALSDEDLYKIVPQSEEIVLEGPPGSGVFCDTSRCLHQGSRARVSPRLVFQFQFVSRPDTLLDNPKVKSMPGVHLFVTRDLVEKFNLSNPDAMRFVG